MESSIDDMKNKINHIKDYTFECDFGKGGVRLIKNTAQKQDIFDGFTGEYHAFNAPLSLEASKLEYHVNIHVNRYKNPEFKVAHYYYPILSSMPSTKKEVWVKNIYKLFQKVASKLNDEEKAKLKFYVPKTENKIAYTQLATYFYGERMKTEVCIMYLHNEASSILEIYDETALEEIRGYIDAAKPLLHLDSILKIMEFIGYLEENYEKECAIARAEFQLGEST